MSRSNTQCKGIANNVTCSAFKNAALLAWLNLSQQKDVPCAPKKELQFKNN